jgi:hypothetical protein
MFHSLFLILGRPVIYAVVGVGVFKVAAWLLEKNFDISKGKF